MAKHYSLCAVFLNSLVFCMHEAVVLKAAAYFTFLGLSLYLTTTCSPNTKHTHTYIKSIIWPLEAMCLKKMICYGWTVKLGRKLFMKSEQCWTESFGLICICVIDSYHQTMEIPKKLSADNGHRLTQCDWNDWNSNSLSSTLLYAGWIFIRKL